MRSDEGTMINKTNIKNTSYKKALAIVFVAAVVFSSGFFCDRNIAEAKKKKAKSSVTKWQVLLEKNGVDRSLWEKCLPKVSHAEYKKVVKTLKKQGTVSGGGSLGPDIRIGLIRLEGSKSDRTIKIRSVEGNYVVKNSAGETIKNVASDDSTTIKQSDNQFLVKGLDPNDLSAYVAKGDLLKIEPDGGEGIFEIYDCGAKFNFVDGKPDKVNPVGCYGDGEYNRFRGKLELSFDKNNDAWAINILPLEQYTWGTGEIGDLKYEYYKLFSIVFRTYGYRNMETRKSSHENHNFDLSDTSLDQIYKGQKIESKFEDMKRATQETRGSIITYKGKTALTPYCSWSDGTRKAYGDYPYLKEMKDKYGKHPSKSTKELEDEGNHMQGLIANGARKMVEDGKSYSDIIQYYYPGVKIDGAY
ncbi:MAG: SpoIID/LytB domain-containing protein [Candidatus Moranbacteria bacterium]|nr:SpoIID/LytB domain-containing protein [Candidatus Moranbacteria bacterium]